MTSLFSSYRLIKDSGLFDETYYCKTYPEVRQKNLDPLLHYLETGARELRNPNAMFDARGYVERCRERGEDVENPLIHFIESRAGKEVSNRPHRHTAPRAPTEVQPTSDLLLNLERVKIESGLGTERLHGYGWCLASSPITEIEIKLGSASCRARYGLQRADVARRHPQALRADHSGFEFILDSIPEDQRGVVELIFSAKVTTGEPRKAVVSVDLAAIRKSSDVDPTANESLGADDKEVLLRIDRPELSGQAAVVPVRDNLEIIGWAFADRGTLIDVAIDGQLLKSVRTGIRRLDVQRAFPRRPDALTAGFSALIPQHSLQRGPHTVSVSLRGHADQAARREFRIEVGDLPDAGGPWSLRHRMSPAELAFRAQPLLGQSLRPSFAVVMPVPSRAEALERARTTVASLATQAYKCWTLWILTCENHETALSAVLEGFEELAERVDVVAHHRADGWLQCIDNIATHLMVVRPGDELGCDALLEYAVYAVLDPQSDFLYADERRMNRLTGRVEAFFKPHWSPDLLLSMNYLGRAWCVRVDVLRRAEICGRELTNVSDYELALRLTEQAVAVRHVPSTLSQATVVEHSEAIEREALKQALDRRGFVACVERGRIAGTFRVKRKLTSRGLVSIVIPTCATDGLIKRCVETLLALTNYERFEIVCIENVSRDRKEWKNWLRANTKKVIETNESFNWSRFNNLAVAAARGEFLLFLNDDVEIIDRSWLDVLLENIQRTDIGVVGPQLLYPDRRVQHAGMFLANLGVARHAFRYTDENDPGYFGLALTQREVIAVTGACLITRRDAFEAVGGFDEAHSIINGDVDYCLRLRQRGLRTIYTPHTTLIHHELASRRNVADNYNAKSFDGKWRGAFLAGDPFFHPRLRKDRDDYATDYEPLEAYCAGHPVFSHDEIRRILIVKLDHIGDCVIALPAVRRLKRHFPAARLTVLTSRGSKGVWELESAVEEIIEFDFFHARSQLGLVELTEEDLRGLRRRLEQYRFDLAVDLRKHGESRPILRYTGARYLAGFDTRGQFGWLDIAIELAEDSALMRKRQHTTDDLINLVDAVRAAGEASEAAISDVRRPYSGGALGRMQLPQAIFRKRVVCVHPGVGNELRQWPPEYFSLLIDQLVETEDVNVIIIGGKEDDRLGTAILNASRNQRSVWSLIGRFELSDLPDLIARCALFVGNNSGPQHIAAGVGVPTVGIHSGVVDAREWGPRGENAVALQRAMVCAPCYHAKLSDCERSLACLRGLHPQDVVLICHRLLAHAREQADRNREISNSSRMTVAVREG